MRPLLLVSAVAALVPAAAGQVLNRAVWLGSESEGVRRDYKQGVEYFVDRASYVDLPPWWRPELDPFADGLSVASGSVSSSRLTTEGVGNLNPDLGAGFSARIAYLQSENQSTQFERIGFGLEKRLSDPTALFLLLEGTQDKSRADLSFGAELFRSAHGAHRVTFTIVDFPWRKSDDFEYETAPYGLLFAGFGGDPDGLQIAYELGFQLPFEERATVTGDVFRMHRSIGSLEARLRIAERHRLVLGFDGELTAKRLSTVDPAASNREDLDTDLERVRLEWWRRGDDGRELSIGASWLHLRTDGIRPNAPAEDLEVRRTEAMLFARARFGIGGSWATEPYVLGGLVRYDERIGDGAPGTERFHGFQGKWGVPFRYAFSDSASIRFDVSFQLDELAFGGGGVQLRAMF